MTQGTPNDRKNWKLKRVALLAGWRLETPWRFSMKETILEDPYQHTLYPKPTSFFVCLISALEEDGSSLLSGGSREWGRWPRLRMCGGARKSVPLEPISPVRNALRPTPSPPRPPSASPASGAGKVWGAPPCPVTTSPGRPPSPQTARAETGLGADPTLRLSRRGQGGAGAPGWGTRNRPEARPGDPPQPDHERGRLSHGFSGPVSVPRRDARAVAVPERLG